MMCEGFYSSVLGQIISGIGLIPHNFITQYLIALRYVPLEWLWFLPKNNQTIFGRFITNLTDMSPHHIFPPNRIIHLVPIHRGQQNANGQIQFRIGHNFQDKNCEHIGY